MRAGVRPTTSRKMLSMELGGNLAGTLIFLRGDTASEQTSRALQSAGVPVLLKPISLHDVVSASSGMLRMWRTELVTSQLSLGRESTSGVSAARDILGPNPAHSRTVSLCSYRWAIRITANKSYSSISGGR